MMIRSVWVFAAIGLLTAAEAAYAADTPPSHPPQTSSGGGAGASGGSTKPTPIPEPEQVALFAMGVAGLIGGRWLVRRRRAD